MGANWILGISEGRADRNECEERNQDLNIFELSFGMNGATVFGVGNFVGEASSGEDQEPGFRNVKSECRLSL